MIEKVEFEIGKENKNLRLIFENLKRNNKEEDIYYFMIFNGVLKR